MCHASPAVANETVYNNKMNFIHPIPTATAIRGTLDLYIQLKQTFNHETVRYGLQLSLATRGDTCTTCNAAAVPLKPNAAR